MSDQVESLVRRYREIDAVILEMKAEQAEIKSQVDSLVEVGWASQIDGQPVHKRLPNRTFCAVTAVDLLDVDQRKQCVVTQYSDALLRAMLKTLDKLDEAMIAKPDAAPVLKIS